MNSAWPDSMFDRSVRMVCRTTPACGEMEEWLVIWFATALHRFVDGISVLLVTIAQYIADQQSLM
jgi:hypothetical protein